MTAAQVESLVTQHLGIPVFVRIPPKVTEVPAPDRFQIRLRVPGYHVVNYHAAIHEFTADPAYHLARMRVGIRAGVSHSLFTPLGEKPKAYYDK